MAYETAIRRARDFIAALRSPDTAATSSNLDQHIAWLKQYVEGMTAANWQDMRLRAERQLEQISKDLDARTAAQAVSVLWCCHARGPDDVYAAPDYATALAWADTLNALNWDSKDPRYPKPRGFKNPSLYEDCLIKAVPAPWPHSPESHAEDLPKSIEGFADPSPISSTPRATTEIDDGSYTDDPRLAVPITSPNREAGS
jgi:hypothetical protein